MNVQPLDVIGGRRAPHRALFALLFVLILLLGGCASEPSAPPAASPAVPSTADAAGVKVETGGMVLPPAGASAPGTEAPAPTPTTAPVLSTDAVITTTASVALYAEPDPVALRFAEYAAGSRLTVIEPDGDHAAYPVAVEGRRWYRVRAEDGLVGWIMEP